MRHNPPTLFFDDGTSITMQRKLGKGAFATVYLGPDGKAYAVVDESSHGTDYSKQILASIRREYKSRYLPAIEFLGHTEEEDYRSVYKMPVYVAPLRKKDHPKAYAQAKVLRDCLEEAHRNLSRRLKWNQRMTHYGHQLMDETVECAKKNKLVPRGLVTALELLRDESANHGSDYTFEFPVRNLATTQSGHLILLDTVFSQEAIEAKRKKEEAKRRRAW
tara:strand:- start:1734 stop:2390 length:657 start_codon:yes stop_codon:yes gene_type:complete